MRAVVVNRYGPPEVARVEDVKEPSPRPGEVLVEVRAAAMTAGDARIRGARFPRGFAPMARLAFGITGPRRRILGSTFAGVVAEVGAGITGLAPGDAVCGSSGGRMGAHAERVVAPAGTVVRTPAAVSDADAAAVVFGGTTALYFLRDRGAIAAGQTVLVNGASGAVGTNAVQLAAHFGARVTGVTSSRNARLVGDLGAERVLDHAVTDVTQLAERYDIVLDTVGNLTAGIGRRLLTADGVLLLAAADLWQLVSARGNVRAGTAPERATDIEFLLGLVATGALKVVIDEDLPLEDVADGYRRIDSGRKVGNIVIRPQRP